MTKKYISIATGLTMAASMAIALPAFADTNLQVGASTDLNVTSNGMQNEPQNENGQRPPMHPAGQVGEMRGGGGMPPVAVGTVSAINGSTLTVVGHQGFGFGAMGRGMGSTTARAAISATTTFAVDATNAVVKKGNASATTTGISSILVGDTVLIQGTISGTNITATMIRDGILPPPRSMGMGRGQKGDNKGGDYKMGSSSPLIEGNGQPVIAGTVSSVNTSTIVITNKSNVSYTIDATNAKILGAGKNQNALTIADIKTGDAIVVQGTINGTSVTAATILEGQAKASGQPQRGFFGGVGQFFIHLFGF